MSRAKAALSREPELNLARDSEGVPMPGSVEGSNTPDSTRAQYSPFRGRGTSRFYVQVWGLGRC